MLSGNDARPLAQRDALGGPGLNGGGLGNGEPGDAGGRPSAAHSLRGPPSSILTGWRQLKPGVLRIYPYDPPLAMVLKEPQVPLDV